MDPVGEVTWAVRRDSPGSAAENMAWDHTLALACPSDRGLLRLYGWRTPTLSLGRNEPARERYDEGRIRLEGLEVVRRPTGGRAVLHHRELTYAVIAPIRVLGGARRAYAHINRALARGLASLGVPVTLADGVPALAPDAGPCFQGPADGEVLARGRKLVGSAQVRMGPNLLQHGSILLGDDQHRIAALTESGEVSGGEAPAALEELLGRRVEIREVEEAVLRGFRGSVPGDWRDPGRGDSFDLDVIPSSPSPELLATYRSPEWTWRR